MWGCGRRPYLPFLRPQGMRGLEGAAGLPGPPGPRVGTPAPPTPRLRSAQPLPRGDLGGYALVGWHCPRPCGHTSALCPGGLQRPPGQGALSPPLGRWVGSSVCAPRCHTVGRCWGSWLTWLWHLAPLSSARHRRAGDTLPHSEALSVGGGQEAQPAGAAGWGQTTVWTWSSTVGTRTPRAGEWRGRAHGSAPEPQPLRPGRASRAWQGPGAPAGSEDSQGLWGPR